MIKFISPHYKKAYSILDIKSIKLKGNDVFINFKNGKEYLINCELLKNTIHLEDPNIIIILGPKNDSR